MYCYTYFCLTKQHQQTAFMNNGIESLSDTFIFRHHSNTIRSQLFNMRNNHNFYGKKEQ